MGALKWGLKATLCNRLQLCTFVAIWALFKSFTKEFSSQNDDNYRQSCAIVDDYLEPPFESPHLDFPDAGEAVSQKFRASRGFLKRALAQTCFRVWYQVRFLRSIFGHSWGLVYGEGGAPGTVPLHNLRVTSHVLHQEVPLGWYRARLF